VNPNAAFSLKPAADERGTEEKAIQVKKSDEFRRKTHKNIDFLQLSA
jgi:hypothetical protein